MKNSNYISALLVLFMTNATAQYSNIERTTINESDVPEEVIRAQRMEFPGGFVTNWKFHKKQIAVDNDATYYMAAFKKAGRLGNYSYYTDTGKLLAYSLYMTRFDLPESIQNAAMNNLNGSVIKSAELIDLENPKRTIYRVRLNSDGSLQYIYFDNNGNQIDKRKLPPDIHIFI